jgi:hypothetical protein
MEILNEKNLKLGYMFIFDNLAYQEKIKGDDLRTAEVSFKRPEDGFVYPGEFHIWFNGSLIHSSKTFKSLQNRLKILVDKWNLNLIDVQ